MLENESAARSATPTPNSALMSGSTAPMTVERMTSSTIAATSKPTTSPGPITDGTPSAMSFET